MASCVEARRVLPHIKPNNRYVQAKSLFPDSECLKECQKQLRSLYQTKNRVKIVPWNQINAVQIDELYTDLSWVMDHRTPKGVCAAPKGRVFGPFRSGKRV